MQLKTAVHFKKSILLSLLVIIHFPHQLYSARCPSVCWCNGDNVSCNDKKLTEIPINLPNDTTYLNMDNNHLQNLNLELLRNLPKLKHLSLRGNQISKITAPTSKLLTNLISLDLHGNCLKMLNNASFSSMPHLVSLDLSQNSLTKAEGIFRNLSHLQRLSLFENSLTDFSNDVFADTVNLEWLNINNNKLKRLELDAFHHLKRLSVLDLRQNDIYAVTGSWKTSSRLQILDLSQCHLADIPSNLPFSLKNLNIGSNRLTSVTKASLENYRQLEFLVLDHNRISSIESRSFLTLEMLHDLDLSDNLISVFPCDLPKSLRDINLDRNYISILNFNSFSRLTYLTSLSLRYNKIEEFARKAFRNLRSLKFLYMDGNPLKMIAENDLAEQRYLEVLSLIKCPLERIELRPFIKLKALKELHLAFMTKISSFNDAVFEMLPSLENLNLQGSPVLISRVVMTQRILASLQDKLKIINIMNGHLTYLPSTFKDYLRNAQKIKLAGNPFHCDANLRWLHDWIKNEPNKFPHKDSITCMKPNHIRGSPLCSLTEKNFQSVSTISSHFNPSSLIPHSEAPASVETTQVLIQDFDDDLMNYPVSGPQNDKNCPSQYPEKHYTNTDIKSEIFKYTSTVKSLLTYASSPRENSRPETTSVPCVNCNSDVTMTSNRHGGSPKKSLTTQIYDKKREEILNNNNNNNNNSDTIAVVTVFNSHSSEEVISEGIRSTKAWPDQISPNSVNTKNKIDNNQNWNNDTGQESESIPSSEESNNEPPDYLKLAAVIASTGAGVLVLSTAAFQFFQMRFLRKKKKQVTSEYPIRNY